MNLLLAYSKRIWPVILMLTVLLVAIPGCKKNALKIDVSNVKIDQQTIRFDSLLFEPHPDSVMMDIGSIMNRYPEFSELYFHKIINIGSPSKRDFYDIFSLFLSEYDYRMAYEKVRELYGDFSSYEQKINIAFKHYHHYFPQRDVPDIYLMLTGFNQSIVAAEDILGIGLDKFLGEQSRFYDQLQISNYMRRRMNPHTIPYEAVKGWSITEFPFNDSVNNLISHMIYHGKILYLMDAFFPTAPDSLKIGYSAKDIAWCRKSEDQVWLYMMDKKILFKNDHMLIKRFIRDAPFTGPYSRKSPGRVGQWTGWQIVRSYMNNNSEITIPELMQNNDYQKILLNSKYNP